MKLYGLIFQGSFYFVQVIVFSFPVIPIDPQKLLLIWIDLLTIQEYIVTFIIMILTSYYVLIVYCKLGTLPSTLYNI